MSDDRAEMIAAVRSEIVGPAQPHGEQTTVTFIERLFSDPLPKRRGDLFWLPEPAAGPQEILYFDRETPHRRYGAGLLHPESAAISHDPTDAAAAASDSVGVDLPDSEEDADSAEDSAAASDDEGSELPDAGDEFEVTSPDVRHPSSIGISCCVTVAAGGAVTIRLPRFRRFSWQAADAVPVQINGMYEQCKRSYKDEAGAQRDAPAWRRRPAVPPDLRSVSAQRSSPQAQ